MKTNTFIKITFFNLITIASMAHTLDARANDVASNVCNEADMVKKLLSKNGGHPLQAHQALGGDLLASATSQVQFLTTLQKTMSADCQQISTDDSNAVGASLLAGSANVDQSNSGSLVGALQGVSNQSVTDKVNAVTALIPTIQKNRSKFYAQDMQYINKYVASIAKVSGSCDPKNGPIIMECQSPAQIKADLVTELQAVWGVPQSNGAFFDKGGSTAPIANIKNLLNQDCGSLGGALDKSKSSCTTTVDKALAAMQSGNTTASQDMSSNGGAPVLSNSGADNSGVSTPKSSSASSISAGPTGGASGNPTVINNSGGGQTTVDATPTGKGDGATVGFSSTDANGKTVLGDVSADGIIHATSPTDGTVVTGKVQADGTVQDAKGNTITVPGLSNSDVQSLTTTAKTELASNDINTATPPAGSASAALGSETDAQVKAEQARIQGNPVPAAQATPSDKQIQLADGTIVQRNAAGDSQQAFAPTTPTDGTGASTQPFNAEKKVTLADGTSVLYDQSGTKPIATFTPDANNPNSYNVKDLTADPTAQAAVVKQVADATGSGNATTTIAPAPAGNTNAGNTNAGNTNAGNTNAGNTNAGNTNAGNTNAGNTNAGNTNAGNTNASNTNTGAGGKSNLNASNQGGGSQAGSQNLGSDSSSGMSGGEIALIAGGAAALGVGATMVIENQVRQHNKGRAPASTTTTTNNTSTSGASSGSTFAVSGLPTTIAVGAVLPSITVQARDSSGNSLASSGETVAINCPSGCSLAGTSQMVMSSGAVTFTGLSFTHADGEVNMVFSAPGIESYTAAINVQQ